MKVISIILTALFSHSAPVHNPQVVNTFVDSRYENVQVSVQSHHHHHHRPAYQVWAHRYYSVRIANCESGGGHYDRSHRYDGDPHLHNQATYTGKWQMGYNEWHSEHGHGVPWTHSEREQNRRAYMLFKARGWEPWACRNLV